MGKFKTLALVDLHFGHRRTNEMHEELDIVIEDLELNEYDMIHIGGDYFDRRLVGNEPAIAYAIVFFEKLVKIAKEKNIKIRIIQGTRSHDEGQYDSLFLHHLNDPDLDIKYYKDTTLEIIDGIEFLFVPEEYPTNIIEHYEPHIERGCDVMLGHGMWSFVGMGDFEDNSETQIPTAPVFEYKTWGDSIKYFALFGHIHKRQIYKDKVFYPGSFTSYGFGDISEKGYATFWIDKETDKWEVDLVNNTKAPVYQSLKLMDLVSEEFDLNDVETLKTLIEGLKETADHTKLSLDGLEEDKIKIFRDAYRNDTAIKLDVRGKRKTLLEANQDEDDDTHVKYEYILNRTMDTDKTIQKFIKEDLGEEMSLERINEIIKE